VRLAIAGIDDASRADPARRTPCARWDLAALVRHVADSAATIRSHLDRSPAEPPTGADCAAARAELRRLQRAVPAAQWGSVGHELVAIVGSFELTIHSWDLRQASGEGAELPRDLVTTLLALAPRALDDVYRSGLFGEEVPAPEACTDLDRLLALFGRSSARGAGAVHIPTQSRARRVGPR
jgi:uncharacterized protein (TIGR03086 family)